MLRTKLVYYVMHIALVILMTIWDHHFNNVAILTIVIENIWLGKSTNVIVCFVLVYGNLCTFTVSKHIVFSDNEIRENAKLKLIAIEYLNTQNKGFVHHHILFNIGFALNRKLFEVFRPSKPGSFSLNYVLTHSCSI